jgi:hypothetical protein
MVAQQKESMKIRATTRLKELYKVKGLLIERSVVYQRAKGANDDR